MVKYLTNSIFRKRYFFQPASFCKHKSAIVVNSIPKCGTNLILNIINSIPFTKYTADFSDAATYKNPNDRYYFILSKIKKIKKGYVFSGHVPFSENFARWINHNGLKQIFIYRNPRDYTVSLYHYIMKNKKRKHRYFDLYKSFGNDSERLKKAITGYGKGKNFYEISENSIASAAIVFKEFSGWMGNSDTLCLKYEDIIAAKGNEIEIIKFINKTLSFLEINNKLTDADKLKIFEKGINPKKSHTFRVGKEGSWKEEYTGEHKKLFNETFSPELLEKFGYTFKD